MTQTINNTLAFNFLAIQWIAFKTIIRKEVIRIFRIWQQTLLAPTITMSLYFAIFGNLIGPRIGRIADFPYMQYLVPGLIMMAVVNNAYTNVVNSFYASRFQRSIEELLVSPTAHLTILLAYTFGGIIRSVMTALLVLSVALLFTHIPIQHIFITLSVTFLSSLLFSLAGFMNALYAKNFDDIAFIPSFVLIPLTYFGGVFYSISMLPPFWKALSHFNPILYLVNAFRFGLLGVSDVNLNLALVITVFGIILLFFLNLYLLKKGQGIRQ